MTFVEAAERNLCVEQRPLHFKEIARLALERGDGVTEGCTPPATMGAVLYGAVKKAQEGGDQCRVRAVGRGMFAISEVSAAGGVEDENRAHNERTRHQRIDYYSEQYHCDGSARLRGMLRKFNAKDRTFDPEEFPGMAEKTFIPRDESPNVRKAMNKELAEHRKSLPVEK